MTSLALAGAPNFRDLGGLPTRSGTRIRSGQMFRSDTLANLTDDDIERIRGLGIHLVCDLRSPAERAQSPSRWPGNGAASNINSNAEGKPVAILATQVDVALGGANYAQTVEHIFRPGFDLAEARRLMLSTYRKMPEVLAPRVAELLHHMANGGDGAVLVHCTAGKDRTGFVIAMVLAALDVDSTMIVEDYLRTNAYFTVDRLIASLRTQADGPLPPEVYEACVALAEARLEYLQTALTQIDQEYHSIDHWLRHCAMLDASSRERLRQRFTEV